MGVELKSFNIKFLPDQVAIGQEVMANWQYQNQSTLEHLQRIYTKDGFDADTRIYAFSDGELIGFQTSQLLDDHVGRLEFPIVKDYDLEISDLLQNETEQRLIAKGARSLRVRASPHWGITEKLAGRYGFHYENPHLMISRCNASDVVPKDFPQFSFVDVDRDDSQSVKLFKQIFPLRFPMRYENEVEEWLSYYAERSPVIWTILTNGNQPEGHIIGFRKDDTVMLTSFFSLAKDQEQQLQALLSYAIKKIPDNLQISLSIGDDQIEYAEYINELGMSLKTKVAYFTKVIE